MIANDYATGEGYQGILREAGPAYFQRAVEAVADAWHTVLTQHAAGDAPPPSAEAVTWYFVGEIAYLLGSKKNVSQADMTYENFTRTNPGIMKAYEKVGDLFYEFGTPDTIERGVHEWQIAVQAVGPERQQVAKKLADYYIALGEAYLKRASEPQSEDTNLPDAMNNFSKALEYDVTNEVAAKRLKETNTAIYERRERQEFYLGTLASADAVMARAQRSAMTNDFVGAIVIYGKATDMYNVVAEKQDEFGDLKKTAKEHIKDIKKNVRDIVTKVLETAQGSMDSGDAAVEQRNFDAGVEAYRLVETIVSVVPDDDPMANQKKELIDTAQKKINEAKRLKDSYLEEQRTQEQQKK
jgi:tetratricopeptide (TPR) repeat protein